MVGICWVLLASGRLFQKPLCTHFLTPSAHRDTHIFGGLGFSLAVELVDGVSPLRQPVVLGVECAQVVDVPQQVGPAALLGAIIMVVGSVEIADQHASKLVTVQTW